jgi:hypothetical protein
MAQTFKQKYLETLLHTKMPQLNTPFVLKLEMFYINCNDSYMYTF